MLVFRSSIRRQCETIEVSSVLADHPKPGVPKPRVIVVEDDPSVLRALRRLILSAGFAVSAFDRPSALLDSDVPATDACLVVDVHLPEMNGVQLCQMLTASGCHLPLILMTGNTDEVTRRLDPSRRSRCNPLQTFHSRNPAHCLVQGLRHRNESLISPTFHFHCVDAERPSKMSHYRLIIFIII